MMDEQLGTLDRGTILVWRLTNVIGWGVLAFAGAILLRYAFEALPFLISNDRWYGILAGIAAPILCGLFIGSVIGPRVATSPMVVAGVDAGVFGIVTCVWVKEVVLFPGGPLSPSLPYWIFLVVPVAIFSARATARPLWKPTV